jgi:hypothetical protein
MSCSIVEVYFEICKTRLEMSCSFVEAYFEICKTRLGISCVALSKRILRSARRDWRCLVALSKRILRSAGCEGSRILFCCETTHIPASTNMTNTRAVVIFPILLNLELGFHLLAHAHVCTE